jgi:hypothetical protein
LPSNSPLGFDRSDVDALGQHHLDMLANMTGPVQITAAISHALANGYSGEELMNMASNGVFDKGSLGGADGPQAVSDPLMRMPSPPSYIHPQMGAVEAGLTALGAILDKRHAAPDVQSAFQGVNRLAEDQSSQAWKEYEAAMAQSQEKLRALNSLAGQAQQQTEAGQKATEQGAIRDAYTKLYDPASARGDKLAALSALAGYGHVFGPDSVQQMLGPGTPAQATGPGLDSRLSLGADGSALNSANLQKVLRGGLPLDVLNQQLISEKKMPLTEGMIADATARAKLLGPQFGLDPQVASAALASREDRIGKLMSQAGLDGTRAAGIEEMTRWMSPDSQEKIKNAYLNAGFLDGLVSDLKGASPEAVKGRSELARAYGNQITSGLAAMNQEAARIDAQQEALLKATASSSVAPEDKVKALEMLNNLRVSKQAIYTSFLQLKGAQDAWGRLASPPVTAPAFNPAAPNVPLQPGMRGVIPLGPHAQVPPGWEKR